MRTDSSISAPSWNRFERPHAFSGAPDSSFRPRNLFELSHHGGHITRSCQENLWFLVVTSQTCGFFWCLAKLKAINPYWPETSWLPSLFVALVASTFSVQWCTCAAGLVCFWGLVWVLLKFLTHKMSDHETKSNQPCVVLNSYLSFDNFRS